MGVGAGAGVEIFWTQALSTRLAAAIDSEVCRMRFCLWEGTWPGRALWRTSCCKTTRGGGGVLAGGP